MADISFEWILITPLRAWITHAAWGPVCVWRPGDQQCIGASISSPGCGRGARPARGAAVAFAHPAPGTGPWHLPGSWRAAALALAACKRPATSGSATGLWASQHWGCWSGWPPPGDFSPLGQGVSWEPPSAYKWEQPQPLPARGIK